MALQKDNVDRMLSALRRVIRAIDLHSRQLVQSHGLTGPQALILRTLLDGGLSAGALAKRVSLSQGTVTDILNRLEQRGLVTRVRAENDRRRVMVELSAAGRECLASSPPLLQDRFASRIEALEDWEQTLLLTSLQRIAAMMDAGDLDAAPVLSSGSVRATPEAVEEVVEPHTDGGPPKDR
ncbi:MAG: MarR family transcriptional regulator [Thiogranum sp.]|nr:MarR family transcriptional regulator [Thiogranum sp.]